jgi:hypothetical protein
MNVYEANKLIKKYANCPKCGNDKLGDGEGSVEIQDEVFTRTCKYGFSVTVDKTIKIVATATKRVKGKTDGVYEVLMPNKIHKYLPVAELKERAGLKRINQFAKAEEWLNSKEGRKWAEETPHQHFI